MTITYDIHIQPVPSSGTKCFGFAYSSAIKIRGPQALVNRWARTLLTPLGSDLLEPKSGTPLGNLIGANLSNSSDVSDIIQMAVFDANEQVQAQDSAGSYPEDECLASASVERLVTTADGLDVWIRLDTVSGDVVQFKAVTLL